MMEKCGTMEESEEVAKHCFMHNYVLYYYLKPQKVYFAYFITIFYFQCLFFFNANYFIIFAVPLLEIFKVFFLSIFGHFIISVLFPVQLKIIKNCMAKRR